MFRDLRAEAPVVASNPTGALTGQRYPDSLIHPDKRAFEPRVAIAWRPLPASSLVIRAGYGVYYDTSVYQTIATQMAQQFPLSKSLSVQNTPANPLTLAERIQRISRYYSQYVRHRSELSPGLRAELAGFRPTRSPGSLQMTATYLGIKGTHGTQEFLPEYLSAGRRQSVSGVPGRI